ncbi:hypothetical protein RF679_15450 [Undibacterium cyanobacteriorum]|uniref:Uncharacterized protein n=1 Tax=Undibacterium cyanobacteriorum TaxID=3073561 RepID=A0ABY9RFM3_9BURK|nr:hypothetical protein [Undibacterium sp. 20NA77.5]WMW80028.1 hypothetical protein RF679_15450 [Undibacterium sp. 20NA77.5]
MKPKSIISAFILSTVSFFAGAKQIERTTILQVKVTPDSYIVEWQTLVPSSGLKRSASTTYKTTTEFSKALQNSKPATHVWLIESPNLEKKRLKEATTLLENAGYKGKIGMIGNEVFY